MAVAAITNPRRSQPCGALAGAAPGASGGFRRVRERRQEAADEDDTGAPRRRSPQDGGEGVGDARGVGAAGGRRRPRPPRRPGPPPPPCAGGGGRRRGPGAKSARTARMPSWRINLSLVPKLRIAQSFTAIGVRSDGGPADRDDRAGLRALPPPPPVRRRRARRSPPGDAQRTTQPEPSPVPGCRGSFSPSLTPVIRPRPRRRIGPGANRRRQRMVADVPSGQVAPPVEAAGVAPPRAGCGRPPEP